MHCACGPGRFPLESDREISTGAGADAADATDSASESEAWSDVTSGTTSDDSTIDSREPSSLGGECGECGKRGGGEELEGGSGDGPSVGSPTLNRSRPAGAIMREPGWRERSACGGGACAPSHSATQMDGASSDLFEEMHAAQDRGPHRNQSR